MKRTSIVVTVGLVVVSCEAVIAEPSASAPAAPGAVVSAIKAGEAFYDFGKAWAGDAVSHTFKLTNSGNTPLAIKNVSASCGCTVIKDYARTIAPGAI
jgi:hypothetical protein